MGAKISKKKGKYDAVKAEKKVELIKHFDLPHSYFYKAPDKNLVTLRSKYKPQYLSQQFEVERNEPYQRHAQSYLDVRDEEYNLYEEIPVRELPSPQPEVKYEPQISVESQENEENYHSSDIEKEVESDHANEQTPEQQLLEIVEKLKVVKKRIKKFDGSDNSDDIRADLVQYITELNAVESTKPTLMELRAALITKSEHFMQALAEKETKLKPVKVVEVEKPTKAYQQVVFDIFAQITADLDILKENIIDYYGTSEGPECKRIGACLDECIENIKSVDPKGDFRIVVAKEEYEDYINRLQAQFDKIVSENEKTFLIDKKTLSTVAKRDNRRKRSQIYFPENDGKFQIPQIDIPGGQYGTNAREDRKSLVSNTEKVYHKNIVQSVEELVDQEDEYNNDTVNIQEDEQEIYNFASKQSPTDEKEAEVYNFANVPKAPVKVYENKREDTEVEAEEYNFVGKNKILDNNQFPNTPEINVSDYQNITEPNALYENQTVDTSSNSEEYNFVRQNNATEEHLYPNIQEIKTNDNQSVPKIEDTKMLTPNTLDVANSRFKRQLSRQTSTLTETTDDEFYDCFDDIPLVSDLDSPDEEFQDSQAFQGSRPQSGFADIFGGLGATLSQNMDSDFEDNNSSEVPVNNENVAQEDTTEGINQKKVSLTESVLFETQFICQYFIQVEKQAALAETKIRHASIDHQFESSARTEESSDNQLDHQKSEGHTNDTSFISKNASLTQDNTDEATISKRTSIPESNLFENQFICLQFIQSERQTALKELEENQLDQQSQGSEGHTGDTSFNSKKLSLTQDISDETTPLKRTSIIESTLFENQLICLQFIQSERQTALEDNKINIHNNETIDSPHENQLEDESNNVQLFQTINPLYESDINPQSRENDKNTEGGIISNLGDKQMETENTLREDVQQSLNSGEFDDNEATNVDQTDKPLEESKKSAYVIEINIPGKDPNIKIATIGAPFIKTSVKQDFVQALDEEEIRTPVSTTKEMELLTNNINMDQTFAGENEKEDDETDKGNIDISALEPEEQHKENELLIGINKSPKTDSQVDENDMGSTMEEPIQSIEVYADENILIEVNVPKARENYPSESEKNNDTITTSEMVVADAIPKKEDAVVESAYNMDLQLKNTEHETSKLEYKKDEITHNVDQDLQPNNTEHEMYKPETIKDESTHIVNQDPQRNNTEHDIYKPKSKQDESTVQVSEQAKNGEDNGALGNKNIFLDQSKSKAPSDMESDWYKVYGIKSSSGNSNSSSQRKTFPTIVEEYADVSRVFPSKMNFIENYNAKPSYGEKIKDKVQKELLSQTFIYSSSDNRQGPRTTYSNQTQVVRESSLFDIDATITPNSEEETEERLVSTEQMYNDPTYLPTYKQALNMQNNTRHTECSNSSLLDVYQENRVSSPSLRKLDVIAEDDFSEVHSSNRVTNVADVTEENALIVKAPKLEEGKSEESNNGNDPTPEYSTQSKDIEILDVEVIDKNANSPIEYNTHVELASEGTAQPRSPLQNTTNNFNIDEKEISDDIVIQQLQRERKLSYRQTRIKLPTISKQTSDQSEALSEEERDTLADLPPTETPWLQEIETVEECVEDMKLCIRDFEGTPKDEIYLNIYENLFNCMSILNKVKSTNAIIIGRKQTILSEIRSCMQQLEVKAS